MPCVQTLIPPQTGKIKRIVTKTFYEIKYSTKCPRFKTNQVGIRKLDIHSKRHAV
jgi:hypothetical protein